MSLAEENCINADTLDALAKGAAEMLRDMEHPALKARAKALAKQALGRGKLNTDRIFWPAGLLLLGLVQSGHCAEAAEYLQPWMDGGMPVQFVDDAVTGFALLELAGRTGEERWLEAADRIADYLKHAPQNEAGAIIYNPAAENRYIYADGAGQSALFLAKYSRVRKDAAAAKLAVQQLSLFLQYGMDAASGLPYHGYVIEKKLSKKLGLVGWGRAAGWLLMGAAACAAELEDADCAANIFHTLLEPVLKTQQETGLFPWLLPAAEGEADTSATAMILWAIVYAGHTITAGRMGAAEYKSDAEHTNANFVGDRGQISHQTMTALFSQIRDGRVYGSLAECIDFAQHPQIYGNYPWGQGTVLALLGMMETTKIC